ncbi:ANTAR domain-containing protein [Mycolicibacterium hippocampi]|uniref:ANTAR domain-containing protein n=1 Tax=Mycolicibacterium hippocampi TaxID=659824 RepID=UPI0013D8084E|nr:ANTAR domain-containing protein [Mycolicibacterium hippocampi]
MAELVSNVARPSGVTEILCSVTARAVELLYEIDFADVLLIDEHQHRSMAATAAFVTELDDMQLELQEGPCLAAAVEDATVICTDLTVESRWPRFAAAATEAGVKSMMSFQLYTYPTQSRGGRGGRGALNLFSRNSCDFTFEDRTIGAMLAAHAAVALISADRQTQFESALASRDLIGQAKGMIMERFKVDANHAFDLLAKLSQDGNTPLRVVAQKIVDSA